MVCIFRLNYQPLTMLRIGNKPWAIAEQQAMVNQAAKYSSYFPGGAIYHTNSAEFAAHYSQVSKDAGITNFKFVITPVK